MEEMQVEDGSNDKAYFTMVPNIVLNHSSAIDQALYMQMKRFAGEKSGGGLCTASHRTLMGKLKIGPKALKASIVYLIDHKWIENVGARKVMTDGGAQDVQIYRVNDIWNLNISHYKGADESTPLSKGGDERTQGADERSKGGDESAPTKNNTKIVVEVREREDAPREPSLGRISKEEKSSLLPLVSWAERERGFKFLTTEVGKQLKALSLARKNGIKGTQLKERWEEMAGDKFWTNAGFDWMNVVTSFNKKV